MGPRRHFMLFALLFLSILFVVVHYSIYDSDKLKHASLPSLVIFSFYMSSNALSMHYSYLDLTLTSMGLNPQVDFVLIHVVKDDYINSDDSNKLVEYDIKIPPNFRIVRYSYSQFQQLIKNRLDITIPISEQWSYKMAEFKPTFAHLFSEHMKRPGNGDDYQWWGYADLDVIWGDLSSFAGIFNNAMVHPIINSGWLAPRGMAAFYINEPWTKLIFRQDPRFLQLLQNVTSMNLDENGLSVPKENVVDEGSHSLHYLQAAALQQRGKTAFRGSTSKDRLFLEKVDSVQWAGPVLWQRGALKTVRSFKSREDDFGAFRPLMFFHRADDGFQVPAGIPRSEWVDDMVNYGFLLPYFTPLVSRYMCSKSASGEFHGNSLEELGKFQPYHQGCFAAAPAP